MNDLERLLAERIAVDGPLSFSEYVEAALYHPGHGFYTGAGRAGRRGDFLTSPEVGPLFGAVLAGALDAWWTDLGRPDPFVFVDAGAGPGTLARAVHLAAPECLAALHYVAVEISGAQRDLHPDWVDSRATLPTEPFVGVVFANELLDNLPFDVVDGGGNPVLVGHDGDSLVAVPGTEDIAPVATGAQQWLATALTTVEAGRIVVVDYTDRSPRRRWLRTYRDHQIGSDPLADPGEQDITIDVPVDQLARVAPIDAESTQGDWLRQHGLDDLVDEGRRAWADGAAAPDLAAMRGRSRVSEAEALTDPDGLGAFRVLEWRVSPG